MRPHASAANAKAAGFSRAAVLLRANLWWLSGFPAGEGEGSTWCVVPHRGERAPERLDLSREHLAEAAHAATKLRVEFSRALASITGNAGKWTAALDEFFALLKPWVHRGRRPPEELFELDGAYPAPVRERARRIAASAPEIRPALRALSWMLFTRREAAGRYLAWLEGHAAPTAALLRHAPADHSRTMLLQLAHLADRAGPDRGDALLGLLADERLYRVPVAARHDFVQHLNGRLRKAEPSAGERPQRPEPVLDGELRAWLSWLLTQDPPMQRRALALFACATPAAIVRAWAEWWPKVERAAGQGEHIQRGYEPEGRKRMLLGRVRDRLAVLDKARPAAFHADAFARMLRAVPQAPQQDFHEAVVRALRRMEGPAFELLRPRFAIYWHLARLSLRQPRLMTQAVAAFASYLARCRCAPSAVRPWVEDVEDTSAYGRLSYSVGLDLYDGPDFAKSLARFFEILARVHSASPIHLDSRRSGIFDAVFGLPLDAPAAARLAIQLGEEETPFNYLSRSCLEAALALSDGGATDFVPLLKALHGPRIDDAAVRCLKAECAALSAVLGGSSESLRELLLEGQAPVVARCAQKLAFLRWLRAPLPAGKAAGRADRSWIDAYPKSLRSALARLADLHPGAEVYARRTLRDVRADGVEVLRERKAVEKRLAEAAGEAKARLERRLANLQARATAPAKPGAARLANLEKKLRRAALHGGIAALEADLDARIPAALCPRLGLDAPPDWLLGPGTMEIFKHLPPLAAEVQELALRLMRVRAGPPPWDLRDDPANAGFLAALKKKGIDTGPWLDGLPPVRHPSPRGGEITLKLEDDPLEIFHMGGHFETCLSPGDDNFFSVFTNAADINKRVLFARDPNGKAVGRCLFALTDRGDLLIFHAYAHHKDLFREEWARDYAGELARCMNARVVPRGPVPVLVAKQWYNDGPLDVGMQFAFLEEGSDFRRILAEAPLGEVLALATRAMGAEAWDEVTVPPILNLAEFTARPELVVALLPVLRGVRRLPELTCMRALFLAEKTGALDQALAVFGPRLHEILRRQQLDHGWMDLETLLYLARNDPGPTLRLLRETRPAGVRDWPGEWDGNRVVAAATCLERLRRLVQARRLFELALKFKNGDGSAARLARDGLARLDAEA